jgi:ADP-ribose pyrophosphatase YjhB (NUDIX family)
MNQQLHKAQLAVLRTIRHAPTARFSELMRPSGLESDSFKFHLRKLVGWKLVEKNGDGSYRLSLTGKEYANNLDKVTRAVQKQPKLSVMVVVRHPQSHDTYLMQLRQRNPYWGYWGFISGPIRWGMTPEDAARQELLKQAGLDASFQVLNFLRKRDFEQGTGKLLEDKQFVIVEANVTTTDLKPYPHGQNSWMTEEELRGQRAYFAETIEVLGMLDAGEVYREKDSWYDGDSY